MATKFQIKRSSVSGRTPNTTNAANSSYIAAGELALNLTDKKMYSSNGTNYFEIGSFKVELVNSTSNVSTFTEISTLQFDEDSGFDVTNPSAGIAKVAMNSTFKFWQVDGVQKLTATGLDTVNFIGGNNISITANGANTPQSIAFATSMTPTFTSVTFGNSTVNTTINSSAIAVSKIFANGVTGSAGQVLSANSTGGIYWETSAGGAGTLTVTSDTFNGNNSNTIFTLSTSSTTDRSFVYLNGVQQAPTTDYTISGTTLTFVVAPPSDNVIEVRSFDIPSIADITVTTDTFTANGTQTNFTLSTPDSSVTNSLVFLNGVTQVPTTDYTLSSTTLTFLSAPANNTAVQAISFTSAGVKSAAFTGNGSNTQFTLPVISTTSKTIVAINGVTQTPVTDYSVSGTTLIFAVAPVNNDNILVRVLPSKVDSAGGNTQIQYNKSGSLGGSAGFTFNDTTNNVTIANTLTVPNFILNASNPPANSTSTGTTGTFAWDSTFFYIATGTNTWKKVPITTDGSGGGGSANTAGSNTQVQFNDSGVLGATAGFTFNKDSNNLTVANTLTVARLSANGSTGADKILAANSTGGLFWSDGGGYGVTRNEFTANGTAVNFTLSRQPFSEEHVLVFVDGVIQRDADISVSGTTLTFAVAPDNLSEIEAFVFQTGAATPGGSNTHIQYNDSGVMEGSAAFTFNEATNTVNLSNTLTIGSNVTVNASAIFIGNSSVNTTITAGNVHLQGTQLTVGNVVVNGSTLTIGSNVTVNTSTIFIGNSSVNTTITAGNVHLQGTQLTVGNTVLTGQQITVGNSTVNSVIRANGATFTGDLMPSANVTYDIGNSAMRWRDLWLSGTTINLGGATIKTDTDTGAIAFVPKATADVPNPKAVVVSPSGGIQAVDTTDGVPIINNSITTVDGVLYGNSTVNTTINSSSVSTIVLNVGSNVFVNTSTIHLGNSTVNTIINSTSVATKSLVANGTVGTDGQLLASNGTALYWTNPPASTNTNAQYTWTNNHTFQAAFTIANTLTVGNSTVNTVINATSVVAANLAGNGALVTSVDAATVGGNTASTLRTYSDTVAATAFSNAAARADSAYSNAVAYAASNTYVNNTFLPLAGGTLTGALTINATANVVSNLSANNVTFRGDVQIDGNLVVSGTSVTLNVATLAVEDNMIHLNNGSTSTHPDLGVAGNYNDGTYKHAGIFRDATDGVWKVFDGYLPEPNTAFIDTSNASFRIADFTANVVTAASFSGNGAGLTSVNASSISTGTVAFARLPALYLGTTQIQSTSAAQAVSGITTLAAGNTTITGFANVSSTLQVTGTSSLNSTTNIAGALAVSNTITACTTSTDALSIYRGLDVGSVGAAGLYFNMGALSGSTQTVGARLTSVLQANATHGYMTIDTRVAGSLVTQLTINNGVTTVNGSLNVSTNTATIGTAAYVVANGNVGIGTATPGNKLEISGTFYQRDAYASIGGYNGGSQNPPFNRYGTTFGTNVTNGQAEVDIWNPTDPATYTSTGILFTQALTSTTRRDLMFLKHDGNVGIGTNTPLRKLDIYGGGLAFTDPAGAHRAIHWGDSATGIFPVTITGSASDGNGFLIFGTNTFGNAATERIRIIANGSVGIGNSAPTQKLHVEGNVYVSGTLTEASSISLKENIDPITGALSVILGINGYTYDRKDGSRKQEPGLIAEEVEQVLPNIVQKDDEGNPTGIQYTKIIAYLVESIKELKAEIDILKGK